MRARRCPWVIAGLWAWRTLLAALVAAPVASLVRQAFPAPPRGDAVLWDPGAHALLAFAAREAHGVSALATGVALVLVAGAAVGLAATATAMVALAHAPPPDRRPLHPARTVALAVARLPDLARLALGVGAAQAGIAAAAYLVARIAIETTSDALGEARAQLLGVLLAAALVLPAVGLGIAHDLARACVVRFRHGAVRAFFSGASAFRRAPFALAWAWAWRGVIGIVPVLAAAAIAHRAGAGGPLALAGVALAHQVAALVRVAFHASWLAKALRSVGR
jgi:hypothetical protein